MAVILMEFIEKIDGEIYLFFFFLTAKAAMEMTTATTAIMPRSRT